MSRRRAPHAASPLRRGWCRVPLLASRAYVAVPARRSRCSRGAFRTSSAPVADSVRGRADAGRGAARSPDAQPASCGRSFPCDSRARTAPSTRHRRRPRPDRQSLPDCVGRDVLAGACVSTPGPAGAVPVRVRSRSSVGLRWRRGRLWHPRKTASAAVPGNSMRRTSVRGSCTSRVRPWNPVVTAIAGPPFPSHRTRTPRECPGRQHARGGPAHAGSGCGPKEADGPIAGRCPPSKRTGKGVSSAINPYE